MSNLVIGYGVQGQKRALNIDSSEKIYIYDPHLKNRNTISNLENFNFNLIQNVYICTPDNLKEFYINKFLKLKKNILIEKPLILRQSVLENIKKRSKAKFYTAYNHRFEPHIVKIKKLLDQNFIGKVYHINIYYGNGTIKLWENSWRSKNKYSILYDLGSHVIDMINFLFGKIDLKLIEGIRKSNELNCYDYYNFYSNKNPSVSCTLSTINWKNFFSLDIIGQNGSINLEGLCKWGPSKLKIRKRVYPSGIPDEKIFTLKKKDPTWKLEEVYFKKKIDDSFSNIVNDIYIKKLFDSLKSK
jgi:scyllo-inositol 2-dehydrogenase (NADP+)